MLQAAVSILCSEEYLFILFILSFIFVVVYAQMELKPLRQDIEYIYHILGKDFNSANGMVHVNSHVYSVK